MKSKIVQIAATILLLLLIPTIVGIVLNHGLYSPLMNVLLLLLTLFYIMAVCSADIYEWLLLHTITRKRSIVKLPSYETMEHSDIITIDATVIAGATVLLTLLTVTNAGSLTGSDLANLLNIDINALIPNTTATIIIIFAFSGVAASVVKDDEIGRRVMVAGFVYLFFAILALTYGPFIYSAITGHEIKNITRRVCDLGYCLNSLQFMNFLVK